LKGQSLKELMKGSRFDVLSTILWIDLPSEELKFTKASTGLEKISTEEATRNSWDLRRS